jgi:hypothetical protein
MSKFLWIAVPIVIAVAVGAIVWNQNKAQVATQTVSSAQIQPQQLSQTLAESPLPSMAPSPSPIAPATNASNTNASSAQQPEGAGGSPAISCNYTVPATPDSYGTAQVSSTWSGLVPGTGGKEKVEVCVTATGLGPRVMSSDTRPAGSKTDSAPWISLGTSYTFTLYDEFGGDAADCNGKILASCQLILPAQPTPKPSGSRK